MADSRARSFTQARGRARRQLLLEAALELLEEFDLHEVTIPHVAQRANIPASSAYNFFSDITDLFVELAGIVSARMTVDSIPGKDIRIWQDIVHEFYLSGAQRFNASRPGRHLLIGPWSPPALKKASNETDEHVADYLLTRLEQHFVLPDIPNRRDVFICAVRIGDAIFGLSVEQTDSITDFMRDEAEAATVAYLGLYLPQRMPRRAPLTDSQAANAIA